MYASALAQGLITAIALIAGLGEPWSGPLKILVLNGFFVTLFMGSVGLVRRADGGRAERCGANNFDAVEASV
jgi:hypothetical protein